MKPQVIKADVGRIVSWNDGNDVYYVGAGAENGVCYKSNKAFVDGIGICYIPEYGFFDEVGIDENVSDEMLAWMDEDYCGHVGQDGCGYTRDDLRDVVEEYVEQCKWLEKYQGTNILNDYIYDVLDIMFAKLHGQTPQWFLDEFDVLEHWFVYLDDLNDKRLTTSQANELGY